MFEFYVNMQKRGDGKVYVDLHKTDERIYFTEEDAKDSIPLSLIPHRHVVKLVACLPEEVDDPHRDEWTALAGACERIGTQCSPADGQALCDAIDRLSAAIMKEKT